MLLVIKYLCTIFVFVLTQHVFPCWNSIYNDITQWSVCSNTLQIVVVQISFIYFVIIPLLIPHPPGLYGLRNGSSVLLCIKYLKIILIQTQGQARRPDNTGSMNIEKLVETEQSGIDSYLCIFLQYITCTNYLSILL